MIAIARILALFRPSPSRAAAALARHGAAMRRESAAVKTARVHAELREAVGR